MRRVLFLFLVIFCFGCAVDPNGGRREIKEQWIENARSVAQKINDPQVNREFKSLEDNLVLARPIPGGIRFIEGAKSKKWVAFVPLLKVDEEIGGVWEGFREAKFAGNFRSEFRALVVKDETQYSPIAKAFVFFHEGRHDSIYEEKPYTHQTDEEYCNEEVQVHIYQNRIMSLLGGKAYEEVLAREVKRITRLAKRVNHGFSIANRDKYDEQLAVAFGKPASDFEKDFLSTSLWIHAVFIYIDRHYTTGVLARKAIFLRAIYKSEGLRMQ